MQSLKEGWFGIKISEREALFFDDGKTLITTTTIAQTCRGVTALLGLPIHTTDGSSSISDYKNKFLYLQSFTTTQEAMLSEVQRATGTTPSEWKVDYKSTDE